MISTLSDLPDEENQWFEFKSSQVPPKSLKEKLAAAASAFSNSGGGHFIVGVDDHGNADGGLSPTHGRTSARDWIDQVIHRVEPAPRYEILIHESSDGRGSLNSDQVIYVVEFSSSPSAPHMAPDGCYYIRAGAHTERASHFLVEALYTRRRHEQPVIRHLLRLGRDNGDFVELVVASLSSEPAMDVKISFDPIGDVFSGAEHLLPIQVPFIDKGNPFVMSIGPAFGMDKHFGENVELSINYSDILGAKYDYKHRLQAFEGLPLIRPQDFLKDIAAASQKIAAKLEKSNL